MFSIESRATLQKVATLTEFLHALLDGNLALASKIEAANPDLADYILDIRTRYITKVR